MRKPKRKKLVLASLEEKLEKYGRRIQRISEAAYELRLLIENMKRPLVSKEEKDAVPNAGAEEQPGKPADADAGRSDVQNPATSQAVLDK